MKSTKAKNMETKNMETQNMETQHMKVLGMSEKKEMIYDLMIGVLDREYWALPESRLVRDEFADDLPCERLYHEVYEANRRICRKLGVEEDRDVECIINNLLEIGKLLSMKMFDYGAAHI